MEGVSEAYHIPLGLRLHGRLDGEALRRALQRIVARHEGLRTIFKLIDGEPVQRILAVEESGFQLVEHDLERHSKARSELDRLVMEEGRASFDLEAGPLIRGRLIRLEEQEHVLLITMHHIVSDGWSMEVFFKELSELYSAFVRGEQDPLPALKVQYADYAVWQREWIKGDILRQQAEYWKTTLAGAPALLEVPADHARPEQQDYSGGFAELALDEKLTAGLQELSKRHGMTLYMTLLAGWAALLARLSGQPDVVIGTPVANRGRLEIEGLIGFFVNTLALRLDVSGSPTVGEWLERVKEQTLAAQQHQDIPFEQVMEILNPVRSLSHSSVFQVMFKWQNETAGALKPPGLEVALQSTRQETAKFDLSLSLQEAGDRIVGGLEYATALFERSTIERYLGYFRALLEAMVDGDSQVVDRLPILSEEERRRVLYEWNDTAVEYPADKCIHELFEEQVRKTPEAVALVYEEESLSYGELNRRANQLAHYLTGLGVKPDERVAICVERSFEMVVGLLGVLKAGGAYVPLDPAYPVDRLRYMLTDSGAMALLTQGHLEGMFAEDSEALPLLNLSCTAAPWNNQVETNPDRTSVGPVPQHLAYVIYTSGSTGTPKGVAMQHGALVNLLSWQIRESGVSSPRRTLQFAALGFDVAFQETFSTLSSGGALVLIDETKKINALELCRLIAAQHIQRLFLPYTALRILVEGLTLFTLADGEVHRTFPLQEIITAGEQLRIDPKILQLFDSLRDCRFQNQYGPTETHVVSSYGLPQETAHWPILPPIGQPIANTRIYILDTHGEPVPVGVCGELYIGGVGVARGYWNRPDLTAERFLRDPFVQDGEARMYKTGDLGRWLADRNIEFLGRNDFQVKIRGFRIELGEIEARLTECEGVREAVVVAREDSAKGDKRLVAYYTCAEEDQEKLGPERLRTHLSAKLPEYMVPAAYVRLESLPLTPNGKLDRKGLPAFQLISNATRRVPETPMQKWLADLWCATLRRNEVSVDDDFFELGGTSIDAAILVNRLQQRIDAIIHIAAIFNAPTISKLSYVLHTMYPTAAAQIDRIAERSNVTVSSRVTSNDVIRMRQIIPIRDRGRAVRYERNQRVVFVLSPPRSGSTLLRTMMGGHKQLFAPPELELLTFDNMEERRAALVGANSFWSEGVIRAVVAARECEVAEAKHIVERFERERCSTQAFYAALQRWIGRRLLIDKTTTYALHEGVLRAAELDFEHAQYIHLIRHPQAMALSFEQARMQQIFNYTHNFIPRQLGELIWTICHQNIQAFLSAVPPSRQHRLYFEQLVRDPETTMRDLCSFLRVDFERGMLEPYAGGPERMTDGLYPESRMLGDVNFHLHKRINPDVAERRSQDLQGDSLGTVTWELAEALGYRREPVKTPNFPCVRLLPITPVERSKRLPLSFAQQRLWFLAQMRGVSEAYHIPLGVELKGELDRAALRQALDRIVARHEALRTTFGLVDEEPAQRIRAAEESRFYLVEHDLRRHEDAVGECERLAREEASTSFDLEAGPLIRGRLIRKSEEEHVLLITMHHIVSDGWSMNVLLKELSVLYGAFARGEAEALPELKLQYADYAVWQRKWIEGEILQRQAEYWKKTLAGAPELLELPADHARPAQQDYAGGYVGLVLEQRLTEDLKALSRRHGTTLYMTLLSGWAALLGRLSGQPDVVIGTPVANRGRLEIEGLIGFFVNTLALRLDVSGSPTVVELLERVKAQALAAQEHQDIPFEQVVELAQPVRSLAHSPLFQVMFAWQNAPEDTFRLSGLKVGRRRSSVRMAKFDMTLTLQAAGERIVGGLEYATALFERETIQRYLGYFRKLLEAMVADENEAVDRLDLLPEAEREQVLYKWNDTAVEYPKEKCIHELFEEQVRKTPEAVAVVYEDESLSYGELNRRANQLAHYLRELGVKPDTRVAICVERGFEMVVGLLGVLKAGAAYVPLDPAYPVDRLRYMLTDSGAMALLTQAHLMGIFQELSRGRVMIDLDDESEWHEERESDPDRVSVGLTSGHLAYVIYTSGTTGLPKGVMVEHVSLLSCISSAVELYGINQSDRILQFGSVAFDTSAEEIYSSLLFGATLVLASRPSLISIETFVRDCDLYGITVLDLPPSFWRELLAVAAPTYLPRPSRLRLVIIGGDVLREEDAITGQRLWAARLCNVYGPTEATVVATVFEVKEGWRRGNPPIGRPIANTRIYILDAHGEPVPMGVAGELYIGGAGVARGYLNQAELTAERFLPDPFVGDGKARMYKTGD